MEIIDTYKSQNKQSLKVYRSAQNHLPSGNTRSALYWNPYPICMRSGKGSRITDIDGNTRIDLNYNNTTLILGHNHPIPIKAAKAQMKKGLVLGAPTETEPLLAEELTTRLKTDLVRFTPTGTEANMQAIRVARAKTGKPLIAKCMGAYHGSWDAVPLTPSQPGIPEGVAQNTVYFPYNNPEEAENIIKEHRDQLAAVIVEPTMRDMTPKAGFLESVREATEQHDVLLVFDEVISFRLSRGGAQEYYNVKPDITTMGKIIGGGFPVGAYASTEEIMAPLRIPESTLQETALPDLGFSGTFNAFPLSMAAGLAVMKEMTTTKYTKIARLGRTMRKELKKTFREEELNIQVLGTGSFFNIHWTDQEVYDHHTASTANRSLANIFNIGMMNHGFYLLGHPNFSTVNKRIDIKEAQTAAHETIQEMKLQIRKRAPHLLN